MPNEWEHCCGAASMFCLPKILQANKTGFFFFSLPPSNTTLLQNKLFIDGLTMQDVLTMNNTIPIEKDNNITFTFLWLSFCFSIVTECHVSSHVMTVFRKLSSLFGRLKRSWLILFCSCVSNHGTNLQQSDTCWIFLSKSYDMSYFRSRYFCYFMDGQSIIFMHHSVHISTSDDVDDHWYFSLSLKIFCLIWNADTNNNTVYSSYVLSHKLLATISEFMKIFCPSRNKISHKNIFLQENCYKQFVAHLALADLDWNNLE